MATFTGTGGSGSPASGSPTGTTYSTLSSSGGQQVGQNVTGQINQYGSTSSYTDPSTGKTYYPGINPLTNLPFGQGPANIANGVPTGGQSQPGYSSGGNQPANQTGSLQGTLTSGQGNTVGGPSLQTPGQGTNASNYTIPTGDQTPTTYTPTTQDTALLGQYDTYTNQLQSLSSQVDQNYNANLNQINAQMGQLKFSQQKENDLYNAGVESSGIDMGLPPQILNGETEAAVSSGIQKIAALTVQQNGLVVAAQAANIQDKIGILKQLTDLQTAKFDASEQMKNDFYDNIAKQQQIVINKMNMGIRGVYDRVSVLPPDQQAAAMVREAQNLGVPVDDLQTAYTTLQRADQAPLTTALAQFAVQNGVPFSSSQLYTAQGQAALMQQVRSSPMFQADLLGKQSTAYMNSVMAQAYARVIEPDGSGGTGESSSGNNLYNQNIRTAANLLAPQGVDMSSGIGNQVFLQGELNQLSPSDAATKILNLGASDPAKMPAIFNAITQVQNIDSTLGKLYGSGGGTNIIAGTVGNLLSKAGLGTNDAKLAGQIYNAVQAYSAATGTAISSSTPLNEIFPGITNGSTLNTGDIQNMEDSLMTQLGSQYQSKLGTDQSTYWLNMQRYGNLLTN